MPMSIDSVLGRAVTKMAGSKPFLTVAPHFIPQLDKLINRASGGRVVLSGAMVPSLMLTTTGAKTGQPRAVPLACLPEDGGSFLVVGSNFGRVEHPGWTANLIAHPNASVTYRGTTQAVRAELLDAAASAEVWPRLLKVWPNYAKYREHAGGRELRVFRLVRP